MADKESTPPPATAAIGSSPVTPAAKRVKTTSSPKETVEATSSVVPAQGDDRAAEAVIAVNTTGNTAGEGHVEGFDDVDDQESLYDGDSAFGTDKSDTTSITSSIYKGYVENGRRYQSVREGEYWGPSDEKQFESMETVHLVHLILDSKQPNPLFHAPITKTAQNILDVGTGTGIWAREVADRFPNTVVYGVDLSPPPDPWVPANCRFEVDDVLKPWMFQAQFDLVHIRWLMGAFSNEQWRLVYKQAYKNLLPGGWIGQVETSVSHYCDDDTFPPDCYLAKWGPMFLKAAEKAGRPLDTVETFKGRIEAAGFVNIHEKVYKVPIGEWTRNPILKEAGRFNKAHLLAGMEGYAMYLLTKFGDPEPWTPEEVQVFLAKIRKDIAAGYHTYFVFRRVWAQKPGCPETPTLSK